MYKNRLVRVTVTPHRTAPSEHVNITITINRIAINVNFLSTELIMHNTIFSAPLMQKNSLGQTTQFHAHNIHDVSPTKTVPLVVRCFIVPGDVPVIFPLPSTSRYPDLSCLVHRKVLIN